MKLKSWKTLKIMILISTIAIPFVSGITYSLFHSETKTTMEDQQVAKFEFEAESTDQVSIPLDSLVPGQVKSYYFSVYNTTSGSISEVSIEYRLTLKTLHVMPINIKLYRVLEKAESLVMNCSESNFTRDENQELKCYTDDFTMTKSTTTKDDYRLEIEFPTQYNSDIYSDLVDYIDLNINSWQKV